MALSYRLRKRYTDNQVISNFEAYGFSDFIPKPYKFDELNKVLDEVLSMEKNDSKTVKITLK